MSTAKAHLKLQTWEWIPDQVASACQVIVYDPDTILPVYQGWTSVEGYVEFDLDPGMYVIWVVGHNPMGYRPFLSDTWIPIAVLPGETREVCAALVSLIDIPVLYDAVQNWTPWTPQTFAELLHQYSREVLKECNATAIQQREALIKEVGTLQKGVVQRVEAPIDVRRDLLQRRREWAEQVVKAAQEHAPGTIAEAHEVAANVVEIMLKRLGPGQGAGCCAELGGVLIDFSQLPFPLGPLPMIFTYCDVEFMRIRGNMMFTGGALGTVGQEHDPISAKWLPAAIRLDLTALPCKVCRIDANVDGRGPEARLDGKVLGGGTQTAACHDKQTLTLTSIPDRPFMSVTLSGAEGLWYRLNLQ
jgi:hypothetical protein